MGNLILDNGMVNNVLLYLILEEDGFFETVPNGQIKGAYIKRKGQLLAVIDMAGGSQTRVDQLVFIKNGIGDYTFKEHICIDL